MPQTEWDVSDARKLRAQLQSVQDFVNNDYYNISDFLCTDDYTTGSLALDNGLPGIRLTNGVDRFVASNHVRPQYWTFGFAKIHAFFWTDNALAAKSVRINITVSLAHPGETSAAVKVTFSQTIAVPTTPWEMVHIDASNGAATGWAVDAAGTTHEHCVVGGELEREGSHGEDNYASSITFLCAQLEFLPASPVAD